MESENLISSSLKRMPEPIELEPGESVKLKSDVVDSLSEPIQTLPSAQNPPEIPKSTEEKVENHDDCEVKENTQVCEEVKQDSTEEALKEVVVPDPLESSEVKPGVCNEKPQEDTVKDMETSTEDLGKNGRAEEHIEEKMKEEDRVDNCEEGAGSTVVDN